MKKNKKILLIIILLLLILFSIIITQQRTQEVNTPSPSPTPEFKELNTIKDGFDKNQPLLNEKDKEQQRLVTELKKISPVKTPDFMIEFSYKTAGFVVSSDMGLNATEKALEIWLNEKGFGGIDSSRFEYRSNKLSL